VDANLSERRRTMEMEELMRRQKALTRMANIMSGNRLKMGQ
jgi:hypothetical protein